MRIGYFDVKTYELHIKNYKFDVKTGYSGVGIGEFEDKIIDFDVKIGEYWIIFPTNKGKKWW